MKTIAIIDDDVFIGDMLETALRENGYLVLRAYSGTEALMLLSQKKPDAILLDLMLPGLSGEALLPRISGIPVIVVSAKADVDGKVAVLSGGAADYITKPFHIKELLARIEVQLRSACAANSAQTLSFGDIALHVQTRAVSVNAQEIRLTRTEFAILKILMLNPEQVVPKSTILDRISEDTPDCTDQSLKMHVSNLRKKLKSAGGGDCIEAVWGIGFKMKR